MPIQARPVNLRAELTFILACFLGLGAFATTVNWTYVSALDFALPFHFVGAFAQGSAITLGITGMAMVFGMIIGVALAILSRTRLAWVRWSIALYVELWRNTPILIQLFWIHFALPMLTGISTSVLVSSLAAMTLQTSAYLTEVVRAGIAAVPIGQWEAAGVLGLSRLAIWRLVILPQALRIMIPPITNVLVSIFKASAVLSALAVGELMSVSQSIAQFTFKPIEILTATGVIYFAFGKILTTMTALVERRTRIPA